MYKDFFNSFNLSFCLHFGIFFLNLTPQYFYSPSYICVVKDNISSHFSWNYLIIFFICKNTLILPRQCLVRSLPQRERKKGLSMDKQQMEGDDWVNTNAFDGTIDDGGVKIHLLSYEDTHSEISSRPVPFEEVFVFDCAFVRVCACVCVRGCVTECKRLCVRKWKRGIQKRIRKEILNTKHFFHELGFDFKCNRLRGKRNLKLWVSRSTSTD